MYRLHQRYPLAFALVWVFFYVFAVSAAETVSTILNLPKVVTAPVMVVLTVVLVVFILRRGLGEKFGIKVWPRQARPYLFFVPLVVLASVNFWNGTTVTLPPMATIFSVIALAAVGFIEEIIFRGFLFRAILDRSGRVWLAVLVSSLTFGLGHLANLFSGQDLARTGLQLLYSFAIGFVFTMVYYRSGSLWPAIITHSIIDVTSIFAVPFKSFSAEVGADLAITALCVAYGLFLWRKSRTRLD